MVAVFVVSMIIAFIIIDIVVRIASAKLKESRERKERLAALDIGLNLDFTDEARTLKRVEVQNPVARILAVDDEAVILDSFRKILVVAGYAIDTVESGREALGLVQKHKYDFVFTDLKMPEMPGLDVVKGVKHFSPETDVIVITGFATIESAVDAMKFGAMDYVQKPFTEDELGEFARKCVIRRKDRQGKQLKPTLHVATAEQPHEREFVVPGGVFVSQGHVWANVTVPGLIRTGIDDFARKMIGRIDSIDFPSKGAEVRRGEPLFTVVQGERRATFLSPVTGKVHAVNAELRQNIGWLANHPYDKGWICSVKPTQLATELELLRISEKAAVWYQQEITRIRELLSSGAAGQADLQEVGQLVEGQLEDADDETWDKFVDGFLKVKA